jgi:hypothetical protein
MKKKIKMSGKNVFFPQIVVTTTNSCQTVLYYISFLQVTSVVLIRVRPLIKRGDERSPFLSLSESMANTFSPPRQRPVSSKRNSRFLGSARLRRRKSLSLPCSPEMGPSFLSLEEDEAPAVSLFASGYGSGGDSSLPNRTFAPPLDHDNLSSQQREHSLERGGHAKKVGSIGSLADPVVVVSSPPPTDDDEMLRPSVPLLELPIAVDDDMTNLPPAPVAGATAKLSRRRRLQNFLTASKFRARRRERLRRRRPLDGGYSSSSDDSDGSMSGNLADMEQIGRPPKCGASYSKGCDEHTEGASWLDERGSSFSVRSVGYARTRVKMPSGDALYDLAAIDAYHSPRRINEIVHLVEGVNEALGCPPSSGHSDIPSVLVINCQMPNIRPPLSCAGEGPTIHVILYFCLSESFRQWISIGLDSLEVPPAARLFARWAATSESDDSMRGRFKLIGNAVNADEIGLPSMCKRFNGKPILIYGRESSFIFHRDEGWAELDVNAHNFSYVGRKGLYSTYGKWCESLLSVGVLIEGREDSELPERILGCALFRGLDLSLLEQLSFSKTNPHSLVVGDEEDIALVKTIRKAPAGIERDEGGLGAKLSHMPTICYGHVCIQDGSKYAKPFEAFATLSLLAIITYYYYYAQKDDGLGIPASLLML